MYRFGKALLSCVIVLVLISPHVAGAVSNGDDNIAAVITDTAAALRKAVPEPGPGHTGGDWAVIAHLRSGVPVPDSYITEYYNNVVSRLEADGGVLSAVKYSEYSRVALALSAVGADPRDAGGYDLLAPLEDFDMTVYQGLNGPVFAIMALGGAGNYDNPVVERYIEYILSKQFDDGGFALSGQISDPDTTAMALTALSGCLYLGGEHRAETASAIVRGVERLAGLQRPDGGFTSFSSTNSESVSQVIITLCSLGISVADERFIKEGNTLPANLLTYYIEGLGFEHERGGGVDIMATEQALCALVALWRYQTGRNALFDMSDAPPYPGDKTIDGLPGKHPDVTAQAVTAPGVVFSRISTDSGSAITRAQLTAALMDVLGLAEAEAISVFSDVPADHDSFDGIRAAYAYGIITGRGDGVFDPDGFVTRQEAAVLLGRVSALCGIGENVVFDDNAVRDIISQYIDYRTAAPWAAGGLAFCYYFGILDDSGIEIRPSETITMGEAVDMVLMMLTKARLIYGV